MPAKRYGGSFAPPLTSETLAEYRALVEAEGESAIKDSLLSLCDMMAAYHQQPASSLQGTPHQSGRGIKTPLEEPVIKALWDHVPWPHECKAMGELFDSIPAASPLRTPAFHLLWFAKELTIDRQPITSDTL